jgi:hypothetical protein
MNNLFEREVADKNVDEQAWLAARRRGITATEVAKLAKGSAATEMALLKEKRVGRGSFTPTRAMAWGLEREQFMIDEVLEPLGVTGGDMLYSAPDNPRHMATPDGIRQENGFTETAELKTGKYDLAPTSPWFLKSGYMDQIQFAMYVLDASRCLYVYERHDAVWIQSFDGFGKEEPTPEPVEYVWIERDQKRIGQLINVADAFLAKLDAPDETLPEGLGDYEYWANEYLTFDAAEKKAATGKAFAADTIRALIGGVESFALETVGAKVSLSTGTRTTFDSKKFQEAEPGLYSEYLKVSPATSTLRVTAKKGTDVDDIF